MIKPEDLSPDASFEDVLRAERVEADHSMRALAFALVLAAAIITLPALLAAYYFLTR